MPKYLGNPLHSDADPSTVGVLLCNLGTPDEPTPRAVRRYLAEFLADPRLVELPRWLWLPILHAVILNIRPRRSAHAYQKVWTPEGSPLRVFSQRQRAAIANQFSAPPTPLTVTLGMRYGSPSIADALNELRAAALKRLIVLPLYPQYSGPASGSVFDAVSAVLQTWRWVPDLHFISSYFDAPGYITALANSIREYRSAHGRGARLFFSFHGLPQKFVLAGDPYFDQCQTTARLVATELKLSETDWQVVFQSRFGRARWLEPYADVTFAAAARAGLKIIDVVCPGFAADCLETLEEIAIQNAAQFQAAGGSALRYIPALNARADHIAALTSIIEQNLDTDPELTVR